MKNRLQSLWDEVAPDSGPCPQPDVKQVQRRVDAALDGKQRHALPRRALRLAVACAAAVLLLTGTALAGGELIVPDFNVLTYNFYRGDNAANAISLMTITPVTVEDDNYNMTVTSSLADGNHLYFTLIIEAKNDAARERLQDGEFGDQLSLRVHGSNSYGISGEIAPEDGVWHLDVSAAWRPSKQAAVRLNAMDAGIWLTFPVKPVRSVKLKLNAEGQGMGTKEHAAGGPVTLETVEVSPLSFELVYTTPHQNAGIPVVYFLWKDGTVKTMGQLDAAYFSGHGGGTNLFGPQVTDRNFYSYDFPSVQDLSQMEAVVFEGTAYPLDGGEPYEVDMSGYPRPFSLKVDLPVEKLDGGYGVSDYWDNMVPFFALCDGLGVPYTWDGETASATFRGVTLTYTVGSTTVQTVGASWGDTDDVDHAPELRDGELWVPLCCWDVRCILSEENFWADYTNHTPYTHMVVIP